MQQEREIFRRSGKITVQANRTILGKEELSTDDVKQYIHEDIKAGRILAEGFTGEVAAQMKSAVQRTEQALKEWPTDRSHAFFRLLCLVANAREQGRADTMEACVRCAIALVQEPIIPTRDRNKYAVMIETADTAVVKAAAEGSAVLDAYKAYTAGVLYNADMFCPQVYTEPVGEQEVQAMRKLFLEKLEVLQGKSPLSI